MSQTEWLPIETAPKDGTPILGFWPGEAGTGIDARNYALTMYERGSWWDADRCDEEYGDPTHWMPLPAPPSSLLLDREEAGGEIAENHSVNLAVPPNRPESLSEAAGAVPTDKA